MFKMNDPITKKLYIELNFYRVFADEYEESVDDILDKIDYMINNTENPFEYVGYKDYVILLLTDYLSRKDSSILNRYYNKYVKKTVNIFIKHYLI